MKIILSRKGFDSSSGGVPSPIFPDGRMLSLPIPDKNSPIRYQDIRWHEYDVGSIVSSLTNGRVPASYRAHLDPDLCHRSLVRSRGWRPIFGQTGGSQGHLRNNGVQKGDLFLFFGLFQDVAVESNRIAWNRTSSRRHILWGWFQIDQVIQPDSCDRSKYEWALYHPHFHRPPERNNRIYVAKEHLDVPSPILSGKPGAGVFPLFCPEFQLTAPSAMSPTEWELPKWTYPRGGRQPLSFHGDLSSWQITDSSARLRAASRGQEFVLDCEYYPEFIGWLAKLFSAQ